jgi:hypothetical protein
MPSVQYGASAYQRTGFPELKLINCYVEQAATSENQVALKSRRGLSQVYAVGSGQIDGILSKAGTFNNAIFSVSGASVFRDAAPIGLVSGAGPVSFAGGYSEVLVTRGGTLRSYNGTNLADAGFVGNASNDVVACCYINGSFIAVEAGSARYYWSSSLDGRTWDVLHYETAERQPDNLLDIWPLNDNLWLFGEQSVEVHADSGDEDARFSPLETLGFNKGIRATGCVCEADNTLFFVGSDNVIYRIADVPQRVSNHGVEERVGASSSVSAFSYRDTGHEFVAIRLDNATMVYDCASQEWHENQTGGGQWLASCACMVGAEPRFGSNAKILGFSGWKDLAQPLERRFTFATPLDQPLSVNRVRLWANSGETLTEISPQIELRVSDDQGKTWTDWDTDDLGAMGDYSRIPEWRALGMFSFPGLMGEGRVTDETDFRLSAVKINDPGGGR